MRARHGEERYSPDYSDKYVQTRPLWISKNIIAECGALQATRQLGYFSA